MLAGRYLLVDRIGAGGTGAVWRARDLRTGAWVAAKVLGRHDRALLLRFVHEQSVRIEHPHVLTPIGWAAEDDVVVLATALVRGGSVADLLADQGPLPEPLVRVAARPDAARAGRGARRRDRAPGRQAGQPAARAHRPRPPAPAGRRLRRRRAPRPVRGPGGRVWPAPTATWRPSGCAAPRPTPARTCTPPAWSPSSSSPAAAPAPRNGAPPGPLRPLLESMTEPDPARRTASVGAALGHLRRLGVPDLLGEPVVPVPDRLGDPPARRRRRWPLVG